MSKSLCTLLGAGLCAGMTVAQADTVALALPAPLPTLSTELPYLPATPALMQQKPPRPVPSWPATPVADSTAAQADISAFGLPCETALQVEPLPGAIFAIAVNAPCKPYEDITFHYAGLTFDIVTGVTGQAAFELPAIASSANLESVFSDGHSISAQLEAPDLSEYARVAVAWTEALDMRLTANAPDHMPVSFYALGQQDRRTVQILSHHQSPEARRAVIRLGVAAPITAQNCGLERHAKIRHLQPDMPSISYDLVLAATSCDRVGGNLELKNVLQDLKLATN